MYVIAKTKKVGGSLAVFLPKDAVKELNIGPDEELGIEVKKHRKSYFGAMPNLPEFTEKDRLDKV